MRYRVYTGPTLVGAIAQRLRNAGVNVFLEGTAHVYVQDTTQDDVLAALKDVSGFRTGDVLVQLP